MCLEFRVEPRIFAHASLDTFFFLDEPHHIRLSTMIKSNMFAQRFYANSVNSMLLQYLDFGKSGVPQMKQELNKGISNIITATSV